MKVENGIIKKADIKLGYEQPCGKHGVNCYLELVIDLEMGGVIVMLNPFKLPLLLKKLELEKFSQFEGTPIKAKFKNSWGECTHISNFLNWKDDGWISTDNDIYFGSDFMTIYENGIKRMLSNDV